MKTIIIAAGESTRLRPLTDDKPKCMLKIKGRPIIQHIIKLFRNNGVSDVSVIRGYKKEKINFPNVTYFENSAFKDNNILHSLITAREKFEEAIRTNEDIIVSYSDIWYEDSVVKKLLGSEKDISAIVDIDWEEYYDGRTDHPISEAEKVSIGNNNKILKIGKNINLNTSEDKYGEFIGLWKFTPEGAKVFLRHFDRLNSDLNKKDPFQSAMEWQKSYITDIFQDMVEKGINIHCVLIKKNWMEFDTIQDFMREAIFTEPLRIPEKGEKVYELESEGKNEILKSRSKTIELDPGMGGVSPKVLTDLLETSSELVSVDLTLTSACNFKCVHCYRPDEEWGNQVIDFDLISSIIEQSCELGVRFFVVTGGEPIMYKHNGKGYFSVVDKIREVYDKAGIDVNVLTFSDVALIDKTKAKMLAERRVGLCLKRDTLDDDIQDGIIGIKGGSKKMIQGYENLFEAGYGSNPDLAVSVNQVLRKGEFNTLDGIVDLHMWIKAHGMEHSVVPIHYCGEALNEEQQEGIHPLEVKAAYDLMSEIDSCEFNDIWKVYSPFPKNKTCNRPGRGVHIRATGKVTSCSESPLIDDYVFGDIHKDKFIDIIRSSKFDNFKEEFALREGKYICNPDVCDLCANHLCRGGCATRSAYSKFDPETGLIVQNTNMQAYSQGREDPLCPAWTVLAQKQGVLKEGVYENVVEGLLANSGLDSNFASRIKQRIVANFSALRNGI